MGSKSKSLNPGFWLSRLRQFYTICWEFDFFFFMISCFFLIDDLVRWNQWMWLVSCSRQGMLIQGLTPYLKCKLNISSIVTLLDLLEWWSSLCCLLLLPTMGRWEGWGWLIYVRVREGEVGASIMFFTFFVFALFLIVLSCLVHHGYNNPQQNLLQIKLGRPYQIFWILKEDQLNSQVLFSI